MTTPFWPRVSPSFLRIRVAVREFAGGSPVIGVSGGADSLALLAAARAERISARPVIIDHGLQPNSATVAAQAAVEVGRCDAEATILSIDVPDTGEGMEAAARAARYEALFEFAEGAEVWVAHTMDDQAETLLLGAMRGRVTGMSPRRGQLVRPLLGVRRADTEAACQELGLRYWEDPHNTDRRFRRVAVRQEVIPLMSSILGGDCVPALAQAADDVVLADSFVRDGIQVGDTLSVAELQVHPARRRQLTVAWLQHHNAQVNRATIRAIERLVTDWHGQGEVLVGAQSLAVRRIDGNLLMSDH
ncbi:MAG: tRNA lysidine(34) synthetase TilS [Corynebacterium sp.]|nr:tRNA lysidine(34) synthetase TilS [Corynebacterium sp.]